MRDIRTCVEVHAMIGAEKLRALHGNAFVHYACWQCGTGGCTMDPTSAIVVGYRVFRVVRLAQAACADSHIIEVDAATMRAVAGQATALQPLPSSPRSGAAAPPQRDPPARGYPA
jgi:hypothetical protein